jgi:hypothetical protein
MTIEKFLDCGGPPQTGWSCRRQQQHHAWSIGSIVEGVFELTEVCRRERQKRLLRWRSLGRTPEVRPREKRQRRKCGKYHHHSSFHFHGPDSLSAMNPAICCGNRVIPATTATAVQSNTCPTILPFTAHCRATRCCQNPIPRSTTDSTRNHARNFNRKALAPAAPLHQQRREAGNKP